MDLKQRLKQMAYDPKAQLRRMLRGTAGSIICMLMLVITSELESRLIFYSLSLGVFLCILYALPGYIGIWLWRMRHIFFEKK